MTRVSVVLYYWILIAAVLLFVRTAGLAGDNSAVIKILIVVMVLYIGVVLISRSKGKGLEEKRAAARQLNSAAGAKRKKKRQQNNVFDIIEHVSIISNYH